MKDIDKWLALEPHIYDAPRLAKAIRRMYFDRLPGFHLEDMEDDVYNEIVFLLIEKLNEATDALAKAFTAATSGPPADAEMPEGENVIPFRGEPA